LIPFHPLADIFPLIEGQEFDDLVADIRAHGLRDQIVLIDGQILDGRNRYRASVAAKLLPENLDELTVSQLKHFRHYLPPGAPLPPQDELWAFVVSKNLRRRHQSASQRAMAVADYEIFRHGGARLTQDANLHLDGMEPATPPLTRAELADHSHVAERLVASAAVIRDKAAPEVKDAVRQGNISVNTAEEIARRPAEEQKAILEALPRDDKGRLTPEAKKALGPVIKEIRAEKQAEKKERRTRKEKELGDQIRALPEEKAGLIISDFEWDFKPYSRESGMDRHASNHYLTAVECRTPEDIVERCRERMSVAADHCVHLMWCPASFNAIALKVMDLQGFKYVSQFVWIKPGLGTGYWVRDCHEILLIGVRGDVPCPSMGEQFRSAIEAPKGEHSAKPDFQYEIAEKYFPNLPKVELNARRARAGWISWGNEAPSDENAEATPDTPSFKHRA
jgi:N6-adenosine-specific RNA methylase IME4